VTRIGARYWAIAQTHLGRCPRPPLILLIKIAEVWRRSLQAGTGAAAPYGRFVAAALLFASPASAHSHHAAPLAPGCTEHSVELRCAASATSAFAPDGALVVVWSAGGRIMAATAPHATVPLSPPVALNAQPEALDATGESRPAVAIDPSGRIVVAYTVNQDKPFSGTVMVAGSTDHGRSFSAPRAITTDARWADLSGLDR
jgi:hypothetical protein